MTQYMLSNITPAGVTPSPDQMHRIITDVIAVTHEMQDAGVWVFASQLCDPTAATVVRATDDGGVTLADGPFAETKEYVGGFTVIEVDDLDAAVGWATKVSRATGLAIEVRPSPNFAG